MLLPSDRNPNISSGRGDIRQPQLEKAATWVVLVIFPCKDLHRSIHEGLVTENLPNLVIGGYVTLDLRLRPHAPSRRLSGLAYSSS